MTLRFHEISEARNRILNPFTDEKLATLAEICRIKPGLRHLDLACGKAEMLCTWARQHGSTGVGVDVSETFLAAARLRAEELDVTARVSFVREDAATYQAEPAAFDIVSCIGATWIGKGVVGTIALMKPALKEGGLLLVGEPYWIEPPPHEAYEATGIGPADYASLLDTMTRFESAGMELVEMVLANQDSWDRYIAPQWLAVSDWLAGHPGHVDAPALGAWIDRSRRTYLAFERRYFGWGVFVLRVKR